MANEPWRDPRRARRVMRGYASQLTKVAQHVGAIVKPFDPHDMGSLATAREMLYRYAEILRPWAVATAGKMLAEVNRRDEQLWFAHAREISKGLREELRSASVGDLVRDLLAEQVGLIQSIPREAAERVHKLSLEALADGTRIPSITDEIGRSGDVARSRAILIAKTEVSRAAETLTQVRAEHIGSPGYIWRTSKDGDVRASHRRMEGKFVPWSTPPIFTEGVRKKSTHAYHAGCFPNCRCYAEPVIPT